MHVRCMCKCEDALKLETLDLGGCCWSPNTWKPLEQCPRLGHPGTFMGRWCRSCKTLGNISRNLKKMLSKPWLYHSKTIESFLDPLFRHTIPEVQKSAQTLLWTSGEPTVKPNPLLVLSLMSINVYLQGYPVCRCSTSSTSPSGCNVAIWENIPCFSKLFKVWTVWLFYIAISSDHLGLCDFGCNVGKTMPCLPPMTGNGNHTTYKFSSWWRMVRLPYPFRRSVDPHKLVQSSLGEFYIILWYKPTHVRKVIVYSKPSPKCSFFMAGRNHQSIWVVKMTSLGLTPPGAWRRRACGCEPCASCAAAGPCAGGQGGGRKSSRYGKFRTETSCVNGSKLKT